MNRVFRAVVQEEQGAAPYQVAFETIEDFEDFIDKQVSEGRGLIGIKGNDGPERVSWIIDCNLSEE